jgi:hypothetical protein
MESMYGKIKVTIKGTSPLLMNRLNPESLKDKGPTFKKQYDPEEEARKSAYITKVNGKEQLYIPSYAIYSMIIKTATRYKEKGRRSSVSGLLAGTIRIEPEKILLGHCDYEIDERPVVIQRSRVLKWRAKIPEWTATFTIVYNRKILTDTVIKTLATILEDAGARMGLLDYRPQHKGWFGTFLLEKFEIEEEMESAET